MAIKPKIILRANQSATIGIGHVMRLKALGQLLVEQGYDVHEVIKDVSIAGSWDMMADLKKMLALISDMKPQWVAIDGVDFNQDYELALKETNVKVLRIVDKPIEHFCADIVLDQNYGAQYYTYDKESHTKVLAGLQHVILRREFRNFPQHEKSIKLDKPLTMLVSLGGSLIFTTKVNEIIDDAMLYSSDVQVMRSKTAIGDGQFCELMAQADIAIVSGGSTMWELMWMQVPFMAVSLNRMQADYLRDLDEQQLCVYLGSHEDLTAAHIKAAVKKFVDDVDLRNQMTRQYWGLFDRHNICKALLEEMKGKVVCI